MCLLFRRSVIDDLTYHYQRHSHDLAIDQFVCLQLRAQHVSQIVFSIFLSRISLHQLSIWLSIFSSLDQDLAPSHILQLLCHWKWHLAQHSAYDLVGYLASDLLSDQLGIRRFLPMNVTVYLIGSSSLTCFVDSDQFLELNLNTSSLPPRSSDLSINTSFWPEISSTTFRSRNVIFTISSSQFQLQHLHFSTSTSASHRKTSAFTLSYYHSIITSSHRVDSHQTPAAADIKSQSNQDLSLSSDRDESQLSHYLIISSISSRFIDLFKIVNDGGGPQASSNRAFTTSFDRE
ncbi:hypothetical protein MRB53_040049 [Persea americana]|nr:hypothetical protein MRB53_040049 [Persea americana]